MRCEEKKTLFFLRALPNLRLLSMYYYNDFQPLSSHGTHNLITKILQYIKNILFVDLTKKIGVILIHSHWTAIVVLDVVILVFDNLREKRSMPLTK